MTQAEVLSAPQTATSQAEVFPVPEALARASHCDFDKYQEMYRRSLDDPEGFWREQAKRLDWVKFPTRIKEGGYDDDVRIQIGRASCRERGERAGGARCAQG